MEHTQLINAQKAKPIYNYNSTKEKAAKNESLHLVQ
jgi:hypothetical protein